MALLASLPPEVLLEIMQFLPINGLLDFGLTCKRYHAIQQRSLTSLRLGVFHSKLSGMVNLMEATANNSCLHSVQMILPKQGPKNKECVIFKQNRSVQEVVAKYQNSLRDLELAMWEFQEGTASLLAGLGNLRHLSIRLDHPHTRHPAIKQGFWQEAPGSTIWNHLAPKAGRAPALGRLQSLNLERAGVTDYQLKLLLKSNPQIRELRLRKCFNLTKETFKYLASSKLGGRLEILHFTMVDSSHIDDELLEYIGVMPKLKVSACVLMTMNATANWDNAVIILPRVWAY